MSELIYKEEAYVIIGKCMEVHNELRHGSSEVIYKDALEIEFSEADIFFEREKGCDVYYKGHILKSKYDAHFVLYDKIVLGVKSVKDLKDEHVSPTINYLKVSGQKLAILVNFARSKLDYRRLVY